MGFQVDRSRLEQIFHTRVISLGGKIETISRLDFLLYENATITGVSASHRHFHAPFIIDGTGRQPWLAGKLNLVAEKSNRAQRIRFGWTQKAIRELDGQPLFRQRRDGWDWRAPLGDGRCAWTSLRYTTDGPGLDYSWRIYRECAGPGYFLLGDAACLMDPSAANGVLRALLSGIYAVHLVVGIEKRVINHQEAAIEYKRWIGEMFDRALALWRTTLPLFREP
jgi:flavin-dependent dehydrogenase